MKFIDLFAGIGGFRRGMELAGHTCVGFCELDKFATASYSSMHLITPVQREKLSKLPLRKRQKEILLEEYRNGEWYAADIRDVDANSLPEADCWCFGAPCQDFSVAGKRKGLDGERSVLVREVFRLLGEIKEESRPEWIIYENVKGMLSSNRGFDYLEILLAMDELGYDCEWQLFNSKDWGVPQNRERVYTIGHLRDRGVRKIFPIEGADGENSISIIGHRKGYRKNMQTYTSNGITESLDTAQEGNREFHVALPCFADINYGAGIKTTENARAIQSRYSKGVCNRSGEISGVAIPIQENILLPGKNYNQRKVVHSTDGISRTLISSGHSGNEPKIVIPVLTPNKEKKRQNGRRFKENGEPMFTLTAHDCHGVGVMAPVFNQKESQGIFVHVSDKLIVYAIWYEKYQCYIAIRKLTPRECFRLQGWEDIYFERAAFVNFDNQLYKQSGNGVTVNVVKAIAEKL